jgi:hypothetical protein
VIAVVLIFLKHSSKQVNKFTETILSGQEAHTVQMTNLVNDHVTLTKETVKAVGRLDATVRSVERTVNAVEQTVGDLKTVVTILSRDRDRERQRGEEKKA